MRYELFLDETGDPSLQSVNENFPIFVLCGVLFTADNYQAAVERTNKLKRLFFDTKNVILHNRDIRKCEGVFAKLFDLTVKERFYSELNHLIATTPFRLVAVAIRKNAFIERYGKLADDPYELSLSFLLERAVMMTDGDDDCVVHVTAESRGRKEDEILQRRFNKLHDVGSSHIDAARFQDRIDSMHFRRKNDNDSGLQIADLCAYPIARHLLYPQIPYPAYDIVAEKFHRSRYGRLQGYGLKVFP